MSNVECLREGRADGRLLDSPGPCGYKPFRQGTGVRVCPLPRLFPSSCVSLGWWPWSSRNRAAERGLLLITKSHSPSHSVRSFGKSGNLGGEYQQGADGGGVWGSRTANVSCMWMGMWT